MSVAALLPAAKIGAGLFGSWLGSRLERRATQPTQLTAADYARSPEEQTAYAGLTGGSRQLTQQGQQTTAQGQPLVAGAANYYGSLLRGNRAAVDAATAPERGRISESYRGAEQVAGRMRGPARDKARLELARQKTSQIAATPLAARQYGAEAGARLGSELTQTGAQQTAAGQQGYGQALASDTSRYGMRLADTRHADQLRLQAAEQQQRAGGNWGQLFTTLLSSFGGGGVGGGGAGSVNGLPITPFRSAVTPNRP